MGNCFGVGRSGAGEGREAGPANGGLARKRDRRPHAGLGKNASISPGHLKVILHNPFPELEGRDLHEDYALGRELGRGEFGVTFLATHKMSERVAACKSISKKKLKSAVDVEDVRREVAIMHHLPPHPNIVGLRGVYEDRAAVHLVEELCEGGELFERILERGHYSERAAAAVSRTIVEVVQVCHRHGVMHRDLKPENFLFQDRSEDAPLRAIDFGLSIMFKEGEVLSEIVGSPYYMAPEVLLRRYGPETDVWSAGVILYILLCGVPPFWAETEQGVAQAVLRGKVDYDRDPWPRVTRGAKELVSLMLQPDPRKRLKAHEVLAHPWLRDAHKVPDTPLGSAVLSRLKQFSNMNKLKKMALRVIAESLVAEEVAGLREMFKLMDTDGSGTITLEELRAGLKRIGSQLGEGEALALMKAADVDGNGTIDYQEFVAATMHLHRTDNDGYIKAAFDHFDKDGSGFIDIAELEDALGAEDGESRAALLDIISEVDTNHDGVISYDEFANMMRKGSEWRKSMRHLSKDRSSVRELMSDQANGQTLRSPESSLVSQ